jgi:hypothetical protein
MTTASREQVANALFSLLQTSYAYPTASRRFVTDDQLSAVQKPALYLLNKKEDHVRGKLQTPAVRSILFDAVIFIAVGMDPNVVPVTTLNNLIDAIDPVSGGVLAPNDHGRQTLGGLVTDCYIEGDIDLWPGDLNGLGGAAIPIKVIFM